MKRLLIASDNFLPRWDGISRFLIELIPYLTNDFDVTVVAPRFPGKEPKLKEVNIIFFPIFNFRYGDYSPAKPKFGVLKKEVKKADIVFTQALGTIGASAIYFAGKLKKPIISYIHSIEWELVVKSLSSKHPLKWFIYWLSKKFIRCMYNKSDLLLVPSSEVADIFNWQRIRTKKTVVHLGVDVDEFKPSENKAEAKAKVNIDRNATVIGFCGRIGREKDLITLYRAFLRLNRRYKNLILLIVGTGVKDIIKVLSSKPNVLLVGAVDNVVPYLQAMDIYVLPSLTETSSLSTMEAMACALPIVSTKVGYVKNYITDGDNGFFFPKGNAFVLAKKIEKLIENNELRQKIGQKARLTITMNYKWSSTVKRIKKILKVF